MDVATPSCSRCGADDVRKHGQHLGKQRYYCKKCGLSFTGDLYRYHPAHDINALRAENQRLVKCLEAARRMDVALAAYLESSTGKALSRLKSKRERFARLLADTHIETDAGDGEEPQPEDDPGIGITVKAATQGSLFDMWLIQSKRP